jgi:hypothetical protein
MEAKELLKPRFEIIADYPTLSYNVGRIIEPIKEDSNYYDCVDAPSSNIICYPQKYPHLFKKLNWWEHRKIEDMPKRLICKAIPNDTEIMEIQEWDMDIMVGWTNKEKRQCCSLHSFNPEYGYFPID